MRKLFFALPILIVMLVLVSSCSKKSEDSYFISAREKLDEARKLDSLGKTEEAKKFYSDAIEQYKEYLKEFPSSTKAVEVYSNIAKIQSDNLKDYPSAIKNYQELSEKFPNSKESKYAMFMIAFIYDEMLKNKELAKQSYQKFLDKYPKDEDANDKMSESARMMLQMLQENKSIEDIIKNTNKQNTADTTKVLKDGDLKKDVKKEDVKKDDKNVDKNQHNADTIRRHPPDKPQ